MSEVRIGCCRPIFLDNLRPMRPHDDRARSSATLPIATSARRPPLSEGSYIVTAFAVAAGITVALRTIPFVAKSAIKDSPLLADLGRWMPLGAVTMLATTAGVRLWRHNTVLSLVTGTTVRVLVTNLL